MLVRNFYYGFLGRIAQYSLSLKTTDGSSINSPLSVYPAYVEDDPHRTAAWVNAPEGESEYGILVGTNDTPPSINDYAIEKIEHGSSPGQLYYYAVTVTKKTEASYIVIEIKRTFGNNTDNDIEVKEYGLVGRTRSGDILLAREVSTVIVPAHGALDVTFIIRGPI